MMLWVHAMYDVVLLQYRVFVLGDVLKNVSLMCFVIQEDFLLSADRLYVFPVIFFAVLMEQFLFSPNALSSTTPCSRQGDDFHRMLTVARLTALSLGDAMMNASHWNHMKELEARVAGRVQQQATTDGGAAAMAAPVSPGQQAAVLNAIPENS